MKLLALKQIPDRTIAVGQAFDADEKHGLRLVESGHAVQAPRPVWDKLRWQGATVVIIASGPSLRQEDCNLVRQWRNGNDRRVIVINTSYQLAPWADILYACDGRWWKQYHKAVKSFAGQRWTQDALAVKEFADLHYVPSESGPGLSRKPGTINQGQNSGYQALGLTYLAGASKAILLGYDMSNWKQLNHWHPDHPRGMHSFPQYAVWLNNFARLAKDLQDSGLEVVNATRRTALKCFRCVRLEDELNDRQ